jgi:vacuolar-type H+-ATPase subunit H
MEIVSRVVEYAEYSSASRITNYNHEEEQERVLQEEILAVVQENVRKAFEEAKRLAEEEAELARRASEAEIKRLADQEAMKILVERAVRIAEVETQKLAEAQEMGPQQGEDTIMVDQETVEPASDKGKDIVVDSTPPSSPVRIIQDSGSPSSAIPPAVQVALDEMKTEMKNEISEIKADMKTEISDMKADMNASGEATNKKIDEMMVFLQELARRLPKP